MKGNPFTCWQFYQALQRIVSNLPTDGVVGLELSMGVDKLVEVKITAVAFDHSGQPFLEGDHVAMRVDHFELVPANEREELRSAEAWQKIDADFAKLRRRLNDKADRDFDNLAGEVAQQFRQLRLDIDQAAARAAITISANTSDFSSSLKDLALYLDALLGVQPPTPWERR